MQPNPSVVDAPAITHPVPESIKHTSEKGGRTHGMPFIFWLLEQPVWLLASVPLALGFAAWAATGGSWVAFGATAVGTPLVLVGLPLVALIWGSYRTTDNRADWEPYLSFKDPKVAEQWRGKKIPMEVVYEHFMAERADFKRDVLEVFLKRNQLFRFCFTWGDIRFYFREFLKQNLTHSRKSDEGDIAHVYNRGNDFYHWFLGDSMTYTSGVFHDPNETLEAAQERKLGLVCDYVQMKPGDRHLDIGCGWGPLITYAAEKRGSHSTGITLAQEQADWARERAIKAGCSERVEILVDDYRNLPRRKYDKITCLEMAEHVGIKNFQRFLLQVKDMLEDDGIFYLQIAGLRRAWQYEDLVWGLFMAKYIFPGADASCPLGFVVSQAERAGFEVHRVENCGVHYSVTIRKWYENWMRNREAVIAKYGQRWFRMWQVFLGWSVLIGGQGSSTVFMITLTKNHKNDKSTVGADEAQHVPFSRQDRWIGRKPVGTQQ